MVFEAIRTPYTPCLTPLAISASCISPVPQKASLHFRMELGKANRIAILVAGVTCAKEVLFMAVKDENELVGSDTLRWFSVFGWRYIYSLDGWNGAHHL